MAIEDNNKVVGFVNSSLDAMETEGSIGTVGLDPTQLGLIWPKQFVTLTCRRLGQTHTVPRRSDKQDDKTLDMLPNYLSDARGWPQSGTSLVHQLFNESVFSSTMMYKCEERFGPRCSSWNHEGQWNLQTARRVFLSGRVLPVEQWSDQIAATIRNEWLTFWDVSKPVLVEKSPHSLLKLPALHQAFSEAGSVRFIIILKHPVTLNIATPRNATWRSLGWLTAMEKLEELLQTNIWSRQSVGIVRYEQFARPRITCETIFRFAFHDSLSNRTSLKDKEGMASQYSNDLQRVCEKWFSSNSQEMMEGRRKLRLHVPAPESGRLPRFKTDLVVESGRHRMKEFWEMIKLLPRSLQDELEKLDKRLRRFGYSLYEEYKPLNKMEEQRRLTLRMENKRMMMSAEQDESCLSSWELA
eukprot:scaffold1389_cov251-Ochromonas_danica.AAC.14